MNTHSVIDQSGTDLPSAEHCERHVVEARRLFQRTLAKWASDVLLLRHRDAQRGVAPGVPAWDGPAHGSLALIHREDHDEWTQAA
jgi:hypothetical protein